MQKIIGILGGIGPEATGEFYLRLINRLQEKRLIKSNIDYPHIIISSIPAQELFLNKPNLEPYKIGLKELEKFNVNFISVPCNNFHLFFDEFQKEISIPIINLKEEVRNYLKNLNLKSMTVFATKTTIESRIYEYPTIKNISLTQKEMEILDNAIRNFNKGENRKEQIKMVEKIIFSYIKKSENVLIGCTELSVMLKNSKLRPIDTLDILVDATIDYYSQL